MIDPGVVVVDCSCTMIEWSRLRITEAEFGRRQRNVSVLNPRMFCDIGSPSEPMLMTSVLQKDPFRVSGITA